MAIIRRPDAPTGISYSHNVFEGVDLNGFLERGNLLDLRLIFLRHYRDAILNTQPYNLDGSNNPLWSRFKLISSFSPPDTYKDERKEFKDALKLNNDPFICWAIFQNSLGSPAAFLIDALQDPKISKLASKVLCQESFWLVQLNPRGKRWLQEFMHSPGFFIHVEILCEILKANPTLLSLSSCDGSNFVDWLLEAIELCKKQTPRVVSFSRSKSHTCHIEFTPGLVTLIHLWESLNPSQLPYPSHQRWAKWILKAANSGLSLAPLTLLADHVATKADIYKPRWEITTCEFLDCLLRLPNPSIKHIFIRHFSRFRDVPSRVLDTLDSLPLTASLGAGCTLPRTEATLVSAGARAGSATATSVATRSIPYVRTTEDGVLFLNPQAIIFESGWHEFLKKVCEALEEQENSSLHYTHDFQQNLIDLLNTKTHSDPFTKDLYKPITLLYCVRAGFFDLALVLLQKEDFAFLFFQTLQDSAFRTEGPRPWVISFCTTLLSPEATHFFKRVQAKAPALFSCSKSLPNIWTDHRPKHCLPHHFESLYALQGDQIKIADDQMAFLIANQDWGALFQLFELAPEDIQEKIFLDILQKAVSHNQIGFLYVFLSQYSYFLNPAKTLKVFKLFEGKETAQILRILRFLKSSLDREVVHQAFNCRNDGEISFTTNLTRCFSLKLIGALIEENLYAPEDLNTSLFRFLLNNVTALSAPVVRDFLLVYRFYFASLLSYTDADRISDLEYLINTQSNEDVLVFLRTCIEEEYPFFNSLCLLVIRHFIDQTEFDKALRLLEGVPFLGTLIPCSDWAKFTLALANSPTARTLVPELLKHLSPQVTRLKRVPEQKLVWQTLIHNLYQTALKDDLPGHKRLVAGLYSLFDISPLRMAATILLTPCYERDSPCGLLKQLQSSTHPKAWRDISGKSLLYYVCQASNSPEKTRAIETILSIEALLPLALQCNKEGDLDETSLHALLARDDVESFKSYIALAPGALFITNGVNQSCLHIISQNGPRAFYDFCLSYFSLAAARKKLFQAAFNQGIRLGYLTHGQLQLLNIPPTPEYLREFLSIAEHRELESNPLARRYFFPDPEDPALTRIYCLAKEELTPAINQLKDFRRLYEYANELIGPRREPRLLPHSTLTPIEIISWDLKVDVPATFVTDLEQELESFLSFLDTLDPTQDRLVRILEDYEIRSIEACHSQTADLIVRLKYHPKIKGLSDNVDERNAYYTRLKQVLFLIYSDCKTSTYSDSLLGWISILSTGGLCAFSIDDLKMIAAPYRGNSIEEDHSLKTRLLRLAAEYRLRITHELAGKYIATNVHAKNGLISKLSSFAVSVEFADPYASRVDFSTYSLVSQDFVLPLALERYHFHGFLRLWREQMKTDPILAQMTSEILLEEPASSLSIKANEARAYFNAFFTVERLATFEESSSHRLTCDNPLYMELVNDFDLSTFLERHADLLPEERSNVLTQMLLKGFINHEFLTFLYWDELAIEQASVIAFEKDLESLFLARVCS